MTEPLAPTWEPRIVLQMLVASDYTAQPRGIMDCVDNDGKPYQSAHMAKLVEHARALVSAPTTIGERQAIAEVVDPQAFNGSVQNRIGEFDEAEMRRTTALAKADAILALRQTLPIHGEMREALERIEAFEIAGNPPAYEDAVGAMRSIARNALQGDGL